MAFEADSTAPPTIINSSVGRTRDYLTGAEVEKLMAAARKSSRYGHRDATMILLAYRHGLRASEVCDLQWHQVELNTGRLHVHRSKRGTPSGERAGMPFPIHRTCSGTPAASPWRTPATIRGPSKPGLAIATSSIRCVTRSSRPIGSRGSGGTSGGWGLPMIDKAGHVAGAVEAVAVFQRHCGTSDEHRRPHLRPRPLGG
jgi:Phage integrase family